MYQNYIEKVAEFLEDNYPDEDIESIKLSYLEEMIGTLSELEDEDIQLNKEILQEIKDSWLALREEI